MRICIGPPESCPRGSPHPALLLCPFGWGGRGGDVKGVAAWEGSPHSRDDTTLDASSTWTVSRYGGVIVTAVCTFDVVAPPMSSGNVNPSRFMVRATWTISSSDGVINPDSPTTST